MSIYLYPALPVPSREMVCGRLRSRVLFVREWRASDSAACDRCDATGKDAGKICPACGGTGRVHAP